MKNVPAGDRSLAAEDACGTNKITTLQAQTPAVHKEHGVDFMTRSLAFILGIPMIGALTVFQVGCGSPSAEPTDTPTASEQPADDHDDAPESYAEAVTLLKEHYSVIKNAFESGNDNEAHEPLHHVGHVLESIPDLAESAQLSSEQIEQVQQAVDEMFAAYGEVDKAMHANEEPDYAAVSETLDTHMSTLEAAVPQ
jgi:hypothetical protein